MTLKEKVYQRYQQQVQDKIDVFRDMIANLTKDAENDAKGSAGDKHETALSMMHLEQEKLSQKLKEVLQQKQVLDNLDPKVQSTSVRLGSLVKANAFYLYVSLALPKIVLEEKTIMALSPNAPLGEKLMGLSVGDVFSIHGTTYGIFEVL